jgi:hypothetical protein
MMPRVVYFEWDQKDVRAVVCEERGERRKLLAHGTIALGDSGGEAVPYVQIGERLAGWLSERKLGRPAAVGVVNRTLVETCLLELPPATDAELPEMVAHQALRQSPAIHEDSTLDFLPFPGKTGQPRRVLAAAVSAGTLQGVRQSLKRAGLKGERLVFRSLAAVQLLGGGTESPETTLMIAPAGDCVDFTLLSAGQPVLVRTVRPPMGLDPEGWRQRVLAEIKRTLVAAPSESLHDGSMDRVVVLGLGDEIARGLVAFLQEQMSATVQEVDVREGFEPSEALSGLSPTLLGLLVAARQRAASGGPTLDFFHPRRPPRRLEKRQLMFAGAAAAILLIGGAWYWIGGQLAELDGEISRLQARRSELDDTLKRTAKQQDVAKELRAWESLSVNWLEELRDFSTRIPDESQLVIQRMSLTPSRDRGGAIDIQGLVRDPATVVQLEQRIRDAHHEIRSKRVQERGQGNNYAWHFESAIAVRPRSRGEYAVAAGLAPPSPPEETSRDRRRAGRTTPRIKPADGDQAEKVTRPSEQVPLGAGEEIGATERDMTDEENGPATARPRT